MELKDIYVALEQLENGKELENALKTKISELRNEAGLQKLRQKRNLTKLD